MKKCNARGSAARDPHGIKQITVGPPHGIKQITMFIRENVECLDSSFTTTTTIKSECLRLKTGMMWCILRRLSGPVQAASRQAGSPTSRLWRLNCLSSLVCWSTRPVRRTDSSRVQLLIHIIRLTSLSAEEGFETLCNRSRARYERCISPVTPKIKSSDSTDNNPPGPKKDFPLAQNSKAHSCNPEYLCVQSAGPKTSIEDTNGIYTDCDSKLKTKQLKQPRVVIFKLYFLLTNIFEYCRPGSECRKHGDKKEIRGLWASLAAALARKHYCDNN
ncbi:hypothetical protein J6590_077588 [Homalodisca vitripennis]|nr:hypothetical protein J6590_077588 [Homalodisca vitripennis]